MPFDALALHAVADEFRATLLAGRVQRVYLPDEHSLVLEVYAHGQRHWLLASAHPEAARVHLVTNPPPRGVDHVTPFVLLLRKHVRDARLTAIEQPPLERLLRLEFTRREEGGLLRRVTLVLELMGRRSNLVLVDEDGAVLDALKRVSRQVNPARPLVPHTRYVPPPQPDRLDPRQLSAYFALEEAVAAGAGARTLAQLLVSHLAGLSPMAAEEIAYRATGEHRAPAPPAAEAHRLPALALHEAACELLAPIETHAWEPHVITREGVAVDAVPYRPRQFSADAVEPAPSMSAALERAAAGRGGAPDAAGAIDSAAHAALRAPLLAALAERRTQAERKLAALQRALDAAARAEALRAAGEAVLANVHAIQPGQERLAFAGTEIALDPARTPVENAQRYFAEYTRARDAARVVPDLMAATRLDLAYVDEMTAHVQLAADPGTLEQLRRELVAQGIVAPSRGEAKRGRPAAPKGGHRRLRLGAFDVLVGTSAVGNERVTFELAGPEDLWLHAHGVPGSHVIVRTGGRAVPPEVLEAAAGLAAWHSSARHDARVLVDWTARKYVRKVRGAPPGLVTYTHEQTLRVEPTPPGDDPRGR